MGGRSQEVGVLDRDEVAFAVHPTAEVEHVSHPAVIPAVLVPAHELEARRLAHDG